MLYDLSFLEKGKEFPPVSEISRIKKYQDNRKLFKGETEEVLREYKKRIQQIVNNFSDMVSFKIDINYHKLVTLKTGDLVYGEPANLTACKEYDVEKLKRDTDFDDKFLSAVYDVSMLGDAVARVYFDEEKKCYNFVIANATMWFPIVDKHNIKKILKHVFAWVEKIGKNNELHIQMHEKGFYQEFVYELEERFQNNVVIVNDENINITTYRIGSIKSVGKVEKTGLKDFAVVHFSNISTSNDIYGVDDYDVITPIVAELEVRYALESVILDKHSCPTPYAPEEAFSQDRFTGEWKLKTGNAFIIGRDSNIIPGYMTWDGSLQANHEMITRLEKQLYSLSEMGAVVDDDSFGASQGYDALEIRMTNAKLKARRLVNKLDKPFKTLISLLSGEKITPEDITAVWNDGLPNNAFRQADIALKEQSFKSNKTILKEHFGYTEDGASEEIDQKKQEQSDSFGGGFGE